MKITCQACAAKYTIADDKVQGKIVKIRCKKCGATIVVNGNGGASAGEPAADAGRFDYASQGGGDQWTVNVADGDQRTMSDGEIVEAYQAGVVTDETFCWKDGMGDWLPLREIEQLYAQVTATRAMPSPVQAGLLAAGRPDADDDGEFATKVQESPLAAGRAASRVPQPPPAANGFAEAAPLAARRPGARAPAADLFGSAAQAGSEEDVMTSAPAGMPQPHAAGDDKLTGQRNENSVLFSLNALTSKGGPGGGGGGGGGLMPAGSEASGLIDIRQLSSQIGLGDDKKKKSRIDDIMNLGGGGAFAPSLGAPVLSAPPIEEYAPPPEATGSATAPPQGKSRALLFGAIGAGVLVIAGAIGVATLMMKGKDDTADKGGAASASASAMLAPSAAPPASALAAAATATAAAAATAAATDSAPVASAAPTDSSAAAPTAAATTAKPATTAAAAAAAAPPPAATTAAAAAAAPPPAAAAAAGASDQPFNMGAAKASLGGIAGGAQSCKKGDVSGSGRATVTFAPSGAVQSVTVEGTGFEGTPTGACVARMFRGARVPPFSGSPFSVRKSFSIN
jgi:predicted Zn finger-like uncharacterized protein